MNQQTAAGFISSGACALGIGKELIHIDAIELRKSDRIEELAYRFKKIVTEALRHHQHLNAALELPEIFRARFKQRSRSR